ncbi:response regulator [Pandoraea sp. NPDC090278]|uniref:response regulator n=1 Tax=Pandoraea sp. NPDC090278 TaxID=3364391 RepID=UPI00383ADEA8
MFRAIIADDHPLILSAIERALHDSSQFSVVALAGSGEELLALLRLKKCELIVTDFSMVQDSSGHDGLSLLRLLRRQFPEIMVVVATMNTNPAVLKQIIACGVRGVVGKEESPEVLSQICVRAMREPYAEVELGPAVTKRLGLYLSKNSTASVVSKLDQLTAKEIEVVRLFAGGMTMSDIASKLNRAISTVATQKKSAMDKLGVQSNADLVLYAEKMGLI